MNTPDLIRRAQEADEQAAFVMQRAAEVQRAAEALLADVAVAPAPAPRPRRRRAPRRNNGPLGPAAILGALLAAFFH